LAVDGGFWAAGLRRPSPALFAAVPMSRDDTGQRLLGELRQRRLGWSMLPELEDVDDIATATAVAATIPGTNFAETVGAINAQLFPLIGSPR
ncbi:MAG: glycosyltransferase, partial [Ilumatobacteraceae bacterium]